MTVYKVLAPIPEIDAVAGDYLVDCPSGGLKLVRRVAAGRQALMFRSSSLRPILIEAEDPLARLHPPVALPLLPRSDLN